MLSSIKNENAITMKTLKILLLLVFLAVASIMFLGEQFQYLNHMSQIQSELINLVNKLTYDIQKGKTHYIFHFISLSFLYGLTHSLGTSHGKKVVASYLVSNKCSVPIAVLMTVTSAFLQAFIAICIVGMMITAFASSTANLPCSTETAFKLCYLNVVGLGFLLMKQALMTNSKTITSYSNILSIVFSVGMKPCSGAIAVLLFANVIGHRELGIISVLAMALGTALTTSIIACISVVTKDNFSNFIYPKKDRNPSIPRLLGGAVLSAIGYVFYTQSNLLGLLEI